MPFTAQCPNCLDAKFRVPWKKHDERMTCPNCHQDFLLLPEGTPQPALASRPGGAVAVKTVSAPVLSLPTTRSTVEPSHGVEAPLVVALASLVLIGVAVIVAYVPYGRFVSIVLAPIGLLASFLSLLSLDRHKKVAWGGMAGHALILLILVAWPALIGIGTWVPPPDPNEGQDQIMSVARDSGQPTPASTVDASVAAWQQHDCRIDVSSVRIAPVDANAKTAEQKKIKALKITLQVSNVGVMRPIEIPTVPTPPNEIKLTNVTGVAIPRKSIDLSKATTVFPGKSLDIILAFDVPSDLSGEHRLELPTGWLGHRDPAVIRIPSAMIVKR